MRYLSVCSGIEAASVAWSPLGWEPVAFSEIEPFPSAVLAHHYPDVPNLGDMTRYREWDLADFDLLVGGTPCQSFSVAGLRKGMDDPRGNLALVFLGIADRFRPRWLVWENVPGVLSSNGGRDFGAFLGALGELGYGWSYRVLDAQYVRVESHPRAVPQRRRRVFVVGHLGDWRRAAAVLLEPESMSGDPPPRRTSGEGAARDVAPGLTGSGRGVERTGESRGQDPLVACARETGQGFWTDDGTAGLRAEPGGMPENLVAHPLTAREGKGPNSDADSGNLVAHALRADGFDASEDGTGRGTPLVAGTLFASGAGTERPSGTASETSFLVPFDTTQLTSAGNYSRPKPGDPCHPLARGQHPPTIAFSSKDHGGDAHEETSPTLRAMNHDGSHANAGGQVAVAQTVTADMYRSGGATAGNNPGVRNVLATPYAVRRLTPRECERLQGFEDDYTLVPYRSKPAKDGPRYRALGNSFAVNVVRWIGQRIQMAEALP